MDVTMVGRLTATEVPRAPLISAVAPNAGFLEASAGASSS